jgi:hypothetical protein
MSAVIEFDPPTSPLRAGRWDVAMFEGESIDQYTEEIL